ncbi:DNA binding [Phytophthora oleae]|uniref:DNA binding n=1 Tax=Phytophthora oleae TaxID=2107226 RepID=A0ABD3FY68_9STRA
MLTLEAIEIAEEHGVEAFRASWTWERRFKERHRLAMRARTRTGQKTPADLADIAAAFAAEVRAAMLDLA